MVVLMIQRTLSPSVLTVTGEFTKVAMAMSSIKN